MTKCIVLGNDQQVNNDPKPIQFIKQHNGCVRNNEWEDCYEEFNQPYNWDNIELVCKSPYKNKAYDIMFAYNNNQRKYGLLMLGRWNDGVVVNKCV
jgi:hypothetical protein